MELEFKSAKELLDLCAKSGLSISGVMRERECQLGETTPEAVNQRMARAWKIMQDSARQPLQSPVKSMGGLIGGEAKKLETNYNKKKSICGDVLQKAMTYAMAVLEVNASMGLIVAAPTAGSAGVVPGLMLAMKEHYSLSDDKIIEALFNAGAVGYLAMRNATVAGAVGGCQAEIGVASAMAASAAVELMGGTITVESKKGSGSAFTVELPMELIDMENFVQQEIPQRKDSLCGIRVLLAEDNDLNAEIAEIQLEELGMTVTRAADGKQAVGLFVDSPAGTFDVILMDIMMPQMNGYEATKAIRRIQNRPDALAIPIIAMTANAFAEDVQASLDAGMNGHLSKPIVIDEVIKTIARNLDR